LQAATLAQSVRDGTLYIDTRCDRSIGLFVVAMVMAVCDAGGQWCDAGDDEQPSGHGSDVASAARNGSAAAQCS